MRSVTKPRCSLSIHVPVLQTDVTGSQLGADFPDEAFFQLVDDVTNPLSNWFWHMVGFIVWGCIDQSDIIESTMELIECS